jgi:hypothetical protein
MRCGAFFPPHIRTKQRGCVGLGCNWPTTFQNPRKCNHRFGACLPRQKPASNARCQESKAVPRQCRGPAAGRGPGEGHPAPRGWHLALRIQLRRGQAHRRRGTARVLNARWPVESPRILLAGYACRWCGLERAPPSDALPPRRPSVYNRWSSTRAWSATPSR